ncbi:MAG: hypothetical protein OXC60_17015 [Litoreibacter sp.]|nr:hypothetical protein [Litoreibacter sp.]
MDAVRLLGDIIAQNAPVSAAPLRTLQAFHALTDGGYIEEAGVVQSIHCNDCDVPHDAAVVFEATQYGIHCPDLGFISKERSELVAVKPNLERLVQNVADALGCKRTKSTPIHGQIWRIGIVTAPSVDVAVYFQPTLCDALDLRSFETALSNETRSQYGIILTASGQLSCPPLKTVQIEDCLAFDEVAMVFEFAGDLLAIAGAPEKNRGGRPSLYAAKLAKIIAARVASGEALPGKNAEARAIQTIYRTENPTEKPPSISTVKNAIS